MSIRNHTRLSHLIAIALVGVSLAACKTTPKPEKLDYRVNHPIQVTTEQVAISISLPYDGMDLGPQDDLKFKRFLREYVQRSRTAITVESTQPDRARAVLTSLGLHDGELFIVSDTTVKAPNAILSFTAHKVVSPECGDWTGNPSFNYNNEPHSNYGCSVQRNISKTVADPGDFLKSAPGSGGNASRTDSGIFTHQSGAAKERLLDGSGNIITGQ